MRQSYAKLADDVELGYQLMMIKAALSPEGFRGHAKGQGFSSWCKENGISRRRAYRLIELAKLVFGIVERARASKILGQLVSEYVAAGKTLPPFDTLRQLYCQEIQRARVMCDMVSDTNERNSIQ